MSAHKARRHGIVFFDSQQAVDRPRRSRLAISALVLVVATLIAIGVWRLLVSQG
jgi:Tfp pilus assembly protein PilX